MKEQQPQSGAVPHRDLLSIADLSPQEVKGMLDLTAQLKARPEHFRSTLAGCHVAMIFEKPSLRTRLTFEAGIAGMGGTTSFVDERGSRIGEREKLSDVAHNLERWVQAIVLRTFAHATVTGMAEHARVPVINALTDLEHPCQALADYFTLQEKFGDVRRIRTAYVGDGNNVAHSLMLTAAALGSALTVATPPATNPMRRSWPWRTNWPPKPAPGPKLIQDPAAVSTRRRRHLYRRLGQHRAGVRNRPGEKPSSAIYQRERPVFAQAAIAHRFHALPAAIATMLSPTPLSIPPRSVVFDQAENRMHVAKSYSSFLTGRRPRPVCRKERSCQIELSLRTPVVWIRRSSFRG